MQSWKVVLFLYSVFVFPCLSFRITDINDHHWQALETNMLEDEDLDQMIEQHEDKSKRYDYESQKLGKEQIGKQIVETFFFKL